MKKIVKYGKRFVIFVDEEGNEFLQIDNVIVAKKNTKGEVFLDVTYWNDSTLKTPSTYKYLTKYLLCTMPGIKSNVRRGIFKIIPLNK